jgi:kinetochore protein NDC80
MSDKTKFIAFIDLHKQKSEKLRVNNERGKARIGEYGEFHDSCVEPRPATCFAQPRLLLFAPTRRGDLAIARLDVKISEASSQAYDAEMQLTKSMDRFDVLVSDYTNIKYVEAIHRFGQLHLGVIGL